MNSKLKGETGEIASEISNLARDAKLEELEAYWLENVRAVPTQPAFLKDWLGRMKKHQALGQAESMMVVLAETRLADRKPKSALRGLISVLPSFSNSAALQPLLAQILRTLHADVEQLETLIAHCGLDTPENLVKGYKAFRDLLPLMPGQVHSHNDWGEGIIRSIDFESGRVTLDFPELAGKEMTFDGVSQFLKHIPPDHFLARKTREPETMVKLAESDPAEVIKQALADQPERMMKQSELKAMLTAGLIAPEDWNGWWAKAREALKLDAFIDFDAKGGARALIRLRDKPRTFQEEIEEQFFETESSPSLRAELIRQLAQRAKTESIPEELSTRMAQFLRAQYETTPPETIALRLELIYMLQDLAGATGAALDAPDPAATLESIRNYQELAALDHVDYAIRALTTLLERDGDAGCQRAAHLLPHAPVRLAQAIWKSLDAEHHHDDAVKGLQALLDAPEENPDTYLWAVRAIVDGSWEHLDDSFPVQALVPELLTRLEDWQQQVESGGDEESTARKLQTRVRALLAANKYDAFGKAATPMSLEQIARLRQRIQQSTALSDSFKAQADRNIRLTRRDLEEGAAPARVSPEDQEHLCTAQSYAAKAAELREISSVKIPHNAKVIEEARMEGDLRENAGYQYAKEEQKMLLQQQATLSDQLSRARIVEAGDIDASKIGFGTRFTAKNLNSGEEETYTVLGRWEANPDRHILSRFAPMAEQFLGAQTETEVTIEHPGGGSTRYFIVSIENALAEDASS